MNDIYPDLIPLKYFLLPDKSISLFKNIDFEVEQLARYNKYRLTLNPIKRLITNIVCEVFRVDWCDSIMGLGKKV